MPTLYLEDLYAETGLQWFTFQETVPGASVFSPQARWHLAENAGVVADAGESADMDSGSTAWAANFTLSEKPAALNPTTGNAFRTGARLTGIAPAGNWSFSFGGTRETNSYTIKQAMRFVVYKSSDPNGANAIDLSGIKKTNFLAPGSTSPVALTHTWAAPRILFQNEFLFLAIALENQFAASNTNAKYWNLWDGSTSYMTMPDLGPLFFEVVGAIGI